MFELVLSCGKYSGEFSKGNDMYKWYMRNSPDAQAEMNRSYKDNKKDGKGGKSGKGGKGGKGK